MKCLAASLIAAAACSAACGAASTSYVDVLEKSLLNGFKNMLEHDSPRAKFGALATSLYSQLQPVASAARSSGDFSPSRGLVGPKPWSPIPPSYYAMLPPYIGSTGGNNTSILAFQSRCGRDTTVKVSELCALQQTRHTPMLLFIELRQFHAPGYYFCCKQKCK